MPNLFKIRNSKFEIRNWQFNKGFTLIELLVVIAIIGILATFIVASFSSAQQRGRDARRKADLDAVKKALELAKNDCTGAKWYPFAGGGSGFSRYSDIAAGGLDSFLDSTSLNYIKALPHDPTKTSGTIDDYHYTIFGPVTGNDVCLSAIGGRTQEGMARFTLSALLENANDPSAPDSLTRCTGGGPGSGVPRTGPYPGGTVPYYVCND